MYGLRWCSAGWRISRWIVEWAVRCCGSFREILALLRLKQKRCSCCLRVRKKDEKWVI